MHERENEFGSERRMHWELDICLLLKWYIIPEPTFFCFSSQVEVRKMSKEEIAASDSSSVLTPLNSYLLVCPHTLKR